MNFLDLQYLASYHSAFLQNKTLYAYFKRHYFLHVKMLFSKTALPLHIYQVNVIT